MNPIRNPQPRRTPRHQTGRRGGRPAVDLLAAHSLRPGTSDAWTPSGRHAVPTEEPSHLTDSAAAAAALDLDLTELDNLDVFAAASIVRRRAHTARIASTGADPNCVAPAAPPASPSMAASTAPP